MSVKPMTGERRQQYRVSELKRYNLTARLVLADSDPLVELVDVSYAGAGIVVPDHEGFSLVPGQGVRVKFESRLMKTPVEIYARVRGRAAAEGGIRYGLAFEDPAELQRRMSPRVAGAFNRRRSFRVTPDSAVPMNARIVRPGTAPFDLPIICISSSGCAVIATEETQKLLMTGDKIALSFEVPGSRDLCRLQGIVRYTLEMRAGMRYGIEFSPNETPHFTRYETMIARYVMQIQRRMLSHAG